MIALVDFFGYLNQSRSCRIAITIPSGIDLPIDATSEDLRSSPMDSAVDQDAINFSPSPFIVTLLTITNHMYDIWSTNIEHMRFMT